MESLISYRKKLAYNFLNPDCRFLFLTFHCPFLSKMLVLNLGHTHLYRHFCKYRYIEMLKISLVLFTISYIFFARQFESKLSLFSLIENVTYFFSPWQSSSKLALLMTYRKSLKSSLLYIIQCFNSAAKILISNLSPNLSAYIKKGGAYILEHKLP